MFRIKLGVGHPGGGELVAITLQVNAVASHSMIPKSLLKHLGVTPKRQLEFALSDGSRVKYGYGIARFRIEGEEWPCPVLFGPEDTYVLGGSTLEIFNLEESDDGLLPSRWLSLGGAELALNMAEEVSPTLVVPLEGYRIRLRYSDGVEGEVDLSRLAGSGVFAAWDDRAVFESARVDSHGAVIWDEGVELCGDALYMQLTGKAARDRLSKAQVPVGNA